MQRLQASGLAHVERVRAERRGDAVVVCAFALALALSSSETRAQGEAPPPPTEEAKGVSPTAPQADRKSVV